jgi:hypothetical protein
MPNPDDLIQIDKLYPRVPGVASELIGHFLDVKMPWLLDIEILEVERPFVVPLFETETQRIFLIGRKDAVIRTPDGIWALEHKTTSLKAKVESCKNGSFFQYKFMNMFGMSPQVSGYTFSLKLEYGQEAMGVYILGYLVHKDILTSLPRYGIENAFKTIPIYKSEELLATWYADTKYWVEQLLKMNNDSSKTEDLHWPHNEASCQHQYGDCEYKDICELTALPSKLPVIPPGYKEEFWEPFDVNQLEEIIKEIER